MPHKSSDTAVRGIELNPAALAKPVAPVRLDSWVFEVPQVAAKEERSVLRYASDGLSGEMGCLGKSDD